MKKAVKRVGICFLLAVFVWTGALISDRQKLREELVRLHVVASSNSETDQSLKLRVRDAVLDSLSAELGNFSDAQQAKAYLRDNLPKIEALANRVLREAGCGDTAVVSLAVEEFASRIYETFTLPSGLYNALRITIGEGKGENWWCVVFPSACLPAAGGEFAEAASCAGFPDSLTAALEGKRGYEIRFFLLDALGKIENLLHRG